jgi:hypothetical protein
MIRSIINATDRRLIKYEVAAAAKCSFDRLAIGSRFIAEPTVDSGFDQLLY